MGQADGTDGDLAMLAPPFIISDEELDLLVQRFVVALRAAADRAYAACEQVQCAAKYFRRDIGARQLNRS